MKLIDKVLTYELFRQRWEALPGRTRTRVRGPVVAQCIGWDAVDAFLRLQGTALIRKELNAPGYEPIRMVQFPDGWDGLCTNMENIWEGD